MQEMKIGVGSYCEADETSPLMCLRRAGGTEAIEDVTQGIRNRNKFALFQGTSIKSNMFYRRAKASSRSTWTIATLGCLIWAIEVCFGTIGCV